MFIYFFQKCKNVFIAFYVCVCVCIHTYTYMHVYKYYKNRDDWSKHEIYVMENKFIDLSLSAH